MSLKQLAPFLNTDRNKVMKYLDQGMPLVEKADNDNGLIIGSQQPINASGCQALVDVPFTPPVAP